MTIIFCLPGSNFSAAFLKSWTNLMSFCLQNGITPILSCRQSCNIYYVRNMCLGGDVGLGEFQKPFNGQVKYDYLMWLDSDVISTPELFVKLLSWKKDIVSGLYKMQGGAAYATVENWDEEFFKTHGYFKFLTPQDIEGKKELIEVNYTGMGFMLVKYGVFESLAYPWFKPIEKRIGKMVDFTMEDVSFCLRAKEAGFSIYVDPTTIVGHEKLTII